jgi:hypothetical protein
LVFHGDRSHFCRSHGTHQIQITHGGAASYPPQWCSSTIIDAPQSPLALLNPCQRISIPSALLGLDWCLDITFRAPYYVVCLRPSTRMGAPQSPIRSASISFQTLYPPPCEALLSMDGQLRCRCPPQSPLALLGLDLRPSISFCNTISTPLGHLTRHQAFHLSWWPTSFSPELIILPFKLHFDSPQG